MYIARGKTIKFGFLGGIFILCILIVSIILTGINQFKLGSQLASINQVSNLSHLLVRQQANVFTQLLAKEAKTSELVEALDQFSREEFVIDAHLYSASGKLLAKSQNALQLKTLLAEPNESATTQQIVEPIFSQQNLVGFLRVTFNAQYGQITKNRVQSLFNNLYAELIILFLTGGLLVSCGYSLFYRRRALSTEPSKPLRTTNKSQAQRFHSRRRRFSS